ncbi:hypothetical protein B0H67DRAFT_686955 [Lasiosphaeris hirsuta]|uniref:Uncharacterized protein n=1 Tax=Lasiosphaeris hirsuta TaxID=260670 RepID=A0AA40DKH5_9PEZI|nr:hypothetical protein B0H67DRAFT_686955 [Lasiosphaeris hirsuta]
MSDFTQPAITYDRFVTESPDVFILLVQDYLRRNANICESCKMRCASAVIESISDIWGLKPKVKRLGVTEENQYGLDLNVLQSETEAGSLQF